ncbi:MAG: hypothetical protein J5824_07910 [Lachnospiraceae bacterium]|nr:hypothetical protein [Lachnospiraceae bacterium]
MSLNFENKSRVYLFSAVNKKTLAIADSVPIEKSAIIFACPERELSAEQRYRIRPLGAICEDMTVSEIIWKIPKSLKGVEIFLFEDESSNLHLLDDVYNALLLYPLKNTKIFFEVSETPLGMFDELTKKCNKDFSGTLPFIMPVRIEMNFVYENFLRCSLFANAEGDGNKQNSNELNNNGLNRKDQKSNYPGDEKHIRALIVGMNERNFEIFRTILHLSQMPGYRLSVMVIENKAHWDTVTNRIPGIYDFRERKDNPIDIHYYEDVDFSTSKFEDYIDGCLKDFNYAFVNAGDDLLNLNLAMRLKAYCIRNERLGKAKIQVNVEDNSICRHWSKEGMEGLETVGDIGEVYNYSDIALPNLVAVMTDVGNAQRGTKDYGTYFFCLPEYNRYSTLARILSLRYKIRVIDKYYDSDYSLTSASGLWKKYEHFRWEMFVRTLGYVKADPKLMSDDEERNAKIRRTAKVHPSLIDYDELSREEQDKDGIELTERIVKILRR